MFSGLLTGDSLPRRGARLPRAQMAELVDAPASGAGARKGVEVRVLFWAPLPHPAIFADGVKLQKNNRKLEMAIRGHSPEFGSNREALGANLGALKWGWPPTGFGSSR